MLQLSYTHQKKLPVLNLLLQGVQGVGAATVQTPVWSLSLSRVGPRYPMKVIHIDK